MGTWGPRYGLSVREGGLDESPDFLDRLRAGDARAFEALVTEHQHRVFGVALRMLGSRAEAEDVAQEVFLRVQRSVAAFRGEARLSTWLYGITSRLCLSRLASPHRRHARLTRPLTEDMVRDPDDPAADAERGEMRAALGEAIAALPEERRIVVILRDVEGLSYEEIAAALNLEPGTVRSRLHRARMELKERLERFLE